MDPGLFQPFPSKHPVEFFTNFHAPENCDPIYAIKCRYIKKTVNCALIIIDRVSWRNKDHYGEKDSSITAEEWAKKVIMIFCANGIHNGIMLSDFKRSALVFWDCNLQASKPLLNETPLLIFRSLKWELQNTSEALKSTEKEQSPLSDKSLDEMTRIEWHVLTSF